MRVFARSIGASLGAIAMLPMLAMAEGAKSGQAFGDWVFQCSAIAEGQTTCGLRQTLVSQTDNKPVAIFRFTWEKKAGELVLTAILPLGIDIAPGVKGTVDDATQFDYNLQTCVPRGCIAAAKIADPLLQSMISGGTFRTTFTLRGAKETTSFSGSLKGFSEGLKALGYD
jgi:invasion protein IalB